MRQSSGTLLYLEHSLQGSTVRRQAKAQKRFFFTSALCPMTIIWRKQERAVNFREEPIVSISYSI